MCCGKTETSSFPYCCPLLPPVLPPLSLLSFNTFLLPLLQSPNDFATDFYQKTSPSSYLPNDTLPGPDRGSADSISRGRPPPPSAYLVYDAVWAAALAFASAQATPGSSLEVAMGRLNFTGVSVSLQLRLLTEEEWLSFCLLLSLSLSLS